MTTIADRYAQITQEAEQRQAYANRPVNAPSEKMAQYLRDLRTRFSISTEGIEMMTAQQVRAEIDELNKRPMPPSERQLEIVHSTIAELREAGVIINISQEKLSALTGGKDGTASKLIEFLFSKRNEVSVNLPITDAQAETIASWYYCPDIPFEEFNVSKRKMRPDIGEKAWERMTQDEFLAEVKNAFTRQEASKFIDDHREKFFQWKRTRITAQQMNYIRQLDERLANVYAVREIGFAIGENGEIVEVKQNNSRDRMPTRAHEPLKDEDLMQLSYEEASTLIDQMRYDSSRRFEGYVDNSQQELQDKVSSFSERYGTGVAKTQNDAMSEELHKLQGLIYKLEAMVGSESPELHDMVNEVFVHQSHAPEVLVEQLRDFMSLAVDDSSDERLRKTYGALSAACEDVPLALQAVASL